MNYMSVGQKVIVHIPPEDRMANKSLMQYHGQEMTIAKRVARMKKQKVYYELVGAESEYGIPYGFIKDWLIPL